MWFYCIGHSAGSGVCCSHPRPVSPFIITAICTLQLPDRELINEPLKAIKIAGCRSALMLHHSPPLSNRDSIFATTKNCVRTVKFSQLQRFFWAKKNTISQSQESGKSNFTCSKNIPWLCVLSLWDFHSCWLHSKKTFHRKRSLLKITEFLDGLPGTSTAFNSIQGSAALSFVQMKTGHKPLHEPLREEQTPETFAMTTFWEKNH